MPSTVPSPAFPSCPGTLQFPLWPLIFSQSSPVTLAFLVSPLGGVSVHGSFKAVLWSISPSVRLSEPGGPASQDSSARRVDVNTDGRVSAKEMQRWIMEKTAEHFQEAVAESKVHFRAVDPDGDGHVSWDEYKVKFLVSKGHNEKEVAKKIRNEEELRLDEETQEVLENLRDRWYQADSPPPDLLLTEEEFLSFLHPEHSRGMLKFMVKEIVRDLGEARAAGLLAASSQPSWGRAAWAGPGLERPRRPHSCPKREGEALPGASGHSWVPGRSCEMHPFWFG